MMVLPQAAFAHCKDFRVFMSLEVFLAENWQVRVAAKLLVQVGARRLNVALANSLTTYKAAVCLLHMGKNDAVPSSLS